MLNMAVVALSVSTFFVTDAVTGQPIQGASCQLNSSVSCDGDGVARLTDASGFAVVESCLKSRALRVSKKGVIWVYGCPAGQI